MPPELVVRRPGVYPPPPAKLLSKRWRNLILGAWHAPPPRLPPQAVLRPYSYELCDDMDPMPGYENVFTDRKALLPRPRCRRSVPAVRGAAGRIKSPAPPFQPDFGPSNLPEALTSPEQLAVDAQPRLLISPPACLVSPKTNCLSPAQR